MKTLDVSQFNPLSQEELTQVSGGSGCLVDGLAGLLGTILYAPAGIALADLIYQLSLVPGNLLEGLLGCGCDCPSSEC